MRILLVQDNKVAAKKLIQTMDNNKIKADLADDGEEGVDLAKIYGYDLIIHDHNLKSMDGFQFVREIRKRRIKTPIVSLIKTHDTNDVIRLLQLGADDCLHKPFHQLELLARAHAIVRRSLGHCSEIISIGDVIINQTTNSVTVGSEIIHFTRREFQILELLALRRNNVVTKESILNHLYNGIDEPEPNIINIYLHKLRRKLHMSKTTQIATEWGRGFKLKLIQESMKELAHAA